MNKQIETNPFRMLGVYSNSSIRDITANKSKIVAFTKVGKVVEFPIDLSNLLSTTPTRTTESIDDAIAKINLPIDKIKYALFWFVNLSPIDDIALKHIQAGNIEKAFEIFNKKKTFTSLLNKGVCSFIYDDKEAAIECITKVIHEEEYRQRFVEAICGTTFTVSENDLAKLFIDELLVSYDASDLVKYFTVYSSDVEYLKSLAIQKPIAIINAEINKAKNCGDSADDEYNAGVALIKRTKSALSSLKKLSPQNDLQYQTVVDALSRQILQCGINYFNASGDEDDAVDKAMELQKYALSIAVSKLLKDRCQENVDTLESQKDTHIIRQELGRLSELIKRFKGEYISDIEQRFGAMPRLASPFGTSPSEIEDFVKKCNVELNSILQKMGGNNEYYIDFSDIVAIVALNKLIDSVNKAQILAQIGTSQEEAKSRITSAILIMAEIGKMQLKPKTREFYNKNKATLQSIYDKLNPSGCYIATMVYGNYEHPKVLVLRDFRDNFLQKNYLGRCFIKFYYKYSPRWVEKLEGKTKINNAIRNILNTFIKLYRK